MNIEKDIVQGLTYFGGLIGIYINSIPLTIFMCSLLICTEIRFK